MYCTFCGQKLPDHVRYCTNCGKTLTPFRRTSSETFPDSSSVSSPEPSGEAPVRIPGRRKADARTAFHAANEEYSGELSSNSILQEWIDSLPESSEIYLLSKL